MLPPRVTVWSLSVTLHRTRCKHGVAPRKKRLSATPIIAKGLLYPLQNQCASKSATHGFASKSDTRHRKKHAQACFFQWSALTRMKNEAGLRPMKRAFGTRKCYRALRFMAATPPLHTSHRLVLHIRKANASFFRLWSFSKFCRCIPHRATARRSILGL